MHTIQCPVMEIFNHKWKAPMCTLYLYMYMLKMYNIYFAYMYIVIVCLQHVYSAILCIHANCTI